jgi:hypothetical protein
MIRTATFRNKVISQNKSRVSSTQVREGGIQSQIRPAPAHFPLATDDATHISHRKPRSTTGRQVGTRWLIDFVVLKETELQPGNIGAEVDARAKTTLIPILTALVAQVTRTREKKGMV